MGKLNVERLKLIAPVSGKEVEVNTINVEQLSLVTSTLIYDGGTRFLGMINGSNAKPDEARLVFLKVWLSDPLTGLRLRKDYPDQDDRPVSIPK